MNNIIELMKAIKQLRKELKKTKNVNDTLIRLNTIYACIDPNEVIKEIKKKAA